MAYRLSTAARNASTDGVVDLLDVGGVATLRIRTSTQETNVGDADGGTLLGTLTLDGVSAASNLVQYFRSYNATTGIVDTGATALSLTMAVGRAHPLDLATVHGGLSRLGLEFLPTSSTATHPIVISTTATVPAIT